jgi:1-deoxy-D-xylulose-5-phosphate synthase
MNWLDTRSRMIVVLNDNGQVSLPTELPLLWWSASQLSTYTSNLLVSKLPSGLSRVCQEFQQALSDQIRASTSVSTEYARGMSVGWYAL